MIGGVKFFALVVLLQAIAVTANVIGIDFASDSVKVALVKPGTPLEIVTNFQSKRKTPSIITFYRGERMFGSDAYALMARKPELTFAKSYRMLGRSIDHPAVAEITKQYFPYELYTNETTGHLSLKQEETYYTPEEIVAMTLQHVKDMTAAFGAKNIKDCVITIPSSFTQHEREAVYSAAEIVDLNVLSLIEENTAAALNYGIDRTFEQPTAVLFYNMGAGSTQVSIASFSSYTTKEGGKNKSISQFEILGKAWDESLGGFNFDLELANLLATRFNTAWSKKASGKDKDLRDFVRPMTRLRLEANKVKEILSANNEYPVKAEQLHADVDLVTKVTRAEFEEACADLLARVTLPIERALAMANLTVKDLHSVELLGGGVRMPKVKKILDEFFREDAVAVGQHLNGDEAMALGAAFRAANISTAFRVRKVGVSDISSVGVYVRLETLPVEEEEKSAGGLLGAVGSFFSKTEKKDTEVAVEPATAWSKFTALYPAKSALPAKSKTVAFLYDKDVSVKVEYNESAVLPVSVDKVLAVYNVTGVAAFAKEAAEKGLGQPKVHLTFSLDSSGITHLIKAEATVELPEEKEEETPVADATTETTTEAATSEESAPSAETDAAAAEGETKDAKADKSEKTDAKKDSKKKETKKPAAKAKKPKDNMLRKTLVIKVNRSVTSPPSWSPAQIAESRSRLRALQDADDLRKANAAALNDLEAYLLKVKNRISDEEEQLKAVSTEEQRQEVVDLANAAEEWLYEDGRDATVAIYAAKQNEIKVKAVAIFNRFSELTKRPETVKKARATLSGLRDTLDGWSLTMPHITDAEKEKVLEAATKAEEWLSEKEAAQAAVSPFEAPVFESTEVSGQLKHITLLVEKLLKKPKPVIEKVTVKSSNDTSSNSTEESETASAEGEDSKPIKIKVNTDEDAGSEQDGEADSSSTLHHPVDEEQVAADSTVKLEESSESAADEEKKSENSSDEGEDEL